MRSATEMPQGHLPGWARGCSLHALQEFGLTPIMWQLADLARWLDPAVRVLTVVHSPRGTPNLEERGLLRAMAQHSEKLVVMTWYGWHSLVAAYGIAPAKLAYIPHGVKYPGRSRAESSLDALPGAGAPLLSPVPHLPQLGMHPCLLKSREPQY